VSPFLEFHFTAMTHERRIAFFEPIANTHFDFAVSAFRKDDHDRRKLAKSAIHQATIDGLVRTLQEWYLFAEECKAGNAGLNEKIVYDECHDVQYVRTLKSSFRKLESSRGSNRSWSTMLDLENRNLTAACNSPTWSWALSAVISKVIACTMTTSAAG
jgi:hypothetical protein